MASYLALNKNGEEILILGKLKDEMEQVMNTKNKHKATIGFQSHLTSMANNQTNTSDLSMTSMYMDPNTKTYNTVLVKKIKTFDSLVNSLKNASLVYNNILTLFNYLGVDMSKNLAFRRWSEATEWQKRCRIQRRYPDTCSST